MIFDSKVIMKSKKEHRCSMCIGVIQKGNAHVAVPYKDGADGSFKDIKICPECAYVMNHADTTTFKDGGFTDINIPNKLRKIRNEYRKDPIGAWDELVKSQEKTENEN